MQSEVSIKLLCCLGIRGPCLPLVCKLKLRHICFLNQILNMSMILDRAIPPYLVCVWYYLKFYGNGMGKDKVDGVSR